MTALLVSPIPTSVSGQRSRTSNTNGTRCHFARSQAANPVSNCGDDPMITWGFGRWTHQRNTADHETHHVRIPAPIVVPIRQGIHPNSYGLTLLVPKEWPQNRHGPKVRAAFVIERAGENGSVPTGLVEIMRMLELPCIPGHIGSRRPR